LGVKGAYMELAKRWTEMADRAEAFERRRGDRQEVL
jgi:hypothetical protein